MFFKLFVFVVAGVAFLRITEAAALKNQYFQNDYKVKLEIIQILNVNRSYGYNVSAGLNWYNRTTRVINSHGILTKDVKNNPWFQVQVYKFLSNEYRHFPLRLSFNCSNNESNLFGMKDVLIKYSNIPTGCDIPKGEYYMKNGIFDDSHLPPLIPSGRYKIDSEVFNGKDFIGTLVIYCAIETIEHLWD